MQARYNKVIIPVLKKSLGLRNVFQVPAVRQVVINVGVGRHAKEKEYIDTVADIVTRIAGQKPVITKAKKSISSFKVRQGMPVGVKATLRGKRMYDFLEKLVNVTLPRVRDFRGLDPKAVDARGNLTIGFKEHLAFPEIRSEDIDTMHGLEVCVATSASSSESGLELLKALGFPFKK